MRVLELAYFSPVNGGFASLTRPTGWPPISQPAAKVCARVRLCGPGASSRRWLNAGDRVAIGVVGGGGFKGVSPRVYLRAESIGSSILPEFVVCFQNRPQRL